MSSDLDRIPEWRRARKNGDILLMPLPHPGYPRIQPSVTYRATDGESTWDVSVRAGRVAMANIGSDAKLDLGPHDFDYCVTVDVMSGRPVVTSLEVITKEGGPPIGGRRFRSIRAGEVADVALLVLSGYQMPRGGASSVRKARKKLQQRDPMVDVSIAVEACRRADSGGSPRLPAVTDALAEAGLPCSPGQARKMIERAIGAGMIAPGRRGRPPSIARPSRVRR